MNFMKMKLLFLYYILLVAADSSLIPFGIFVD